MIRFLQTPGRTKKLVLGGILLFFCISLVITLIPGLTGDFSAAREGVLAKVGRDEITVSEVYERGERLSRRSLAGPEFNQMFENILSEKIMLMETDRLGLRVTDDEMRDFLQKHFKDALFPNGQYVGEDGYAAFTQQTFNLPLTEFERELKFSLLFGKLQNMVTAAAEVPADEIQREFLKRNTKVKLQYAVIKADQVSGEVKPNEAEIKAYYDQNKARYSAPLPEKRKARYIVIDVAKLQDQIKPSIDDLTRYYNANKDQYRVPEEVKASHILIKVPPAADSKTDQAARAKAEDIVKQLKAGAKFDDLAKKDSEDKGTAEQAGLVGWLRRDTGSAMGAEFDKVVFSLAPGQISDPVKTRLGYHIIRVEDKHEARQKSLEEVRSTIEPQVKGFKARDQAEKLASQVTTQAKAQGLDAAAAKNNLDVVSSDWFSRTDSLPGIGNSPEFVSAVFGMKEKSPPSEVGTSTAYVVFELTAIKAPTVPTYEEVKSKVETNYKNELTSSLVYKKTQQLSDRAHALHDLARAAKELGAKVEGSDLVGPEKQLPDLGPMSGQASVAFSMKPGDISTPLLAGGKNGAVIALLERQEPSPADLEKSRDQIREGLIAQKRQEMLRLYEEGLKLSLEKEGKVKIYQQQLDLYTKRGTEGGGL